jgi:excisionase family DNA binding protein
MTDVASTADRLLYTPNEAAETLGIGRSTLYVLLARGAIASVRIGTSRRIPATALHSFIHELTEEASSLPDDKVEDFAAFAPAVPLPSNLNDGKG